MLSIEDYERLRAQPCWFLLVAGHEDAEETHERIVDAENGYAIVERVGAPGWRQPDSTHASAADSS